MQILNILEKIFKKVSSLWLSFLNYFYYTAKPSFLNPIAYLRKVSDKEGEKEFKKIDGGNLYKLISEIKEKSGSTGCEYADYLILYNNVIKRKPLNVLELGSGISTCVIAYALKKNSDQHNIQSKITTMEESEFYYQDFLKIIPSSLKSYINPLHSPRQTRYYSEKLGCFYKEIPSVDGGYDFLFIDAPQLYFPGDAMKCFDADLINLINDNKLNTCFILLDQRIGTLWALNKLIPPLKLKYDVIKRQSTAVLEI
tara:strand:+ start:14776 stop:15540 length:765 start_codon:yes stop_codon:yes gene_type:complete